jgi:hypothetical protein
MTGWWQPGTPGGTLLSRRYVQAFVFALPGLKRAELENTLRYKVRTILPVQTDAFAFRTHLFRNAGQTFGAAFLATDEIRTLDSASSRPLRLGFPLTVPAAWGPQALLFVSSPEGIEAHFYESGVLKTSFAPIVSGEQRLVRRLLDLHREARVFGWAPDAQFPLPEGAWEPVPASMATACPLWEPPPPRKLPLVVGIALLACGLALLGSLAADALTQREQRNGAWTAWLKHVGAMPTGPGRSVLLQAAGLPVPEIFGRLAQAWPAGTRIESFQWTPGKLVLVARGASALRSLQALTADSWFRSLKVDEIHALKEGGEEFTVEGGLNLEP